MKITSSIIWILLVSMLIVSCTKEVKHGVTSKDELYIYLDSLEKRYESTCKKIQLDEWSTRTQLGSSEMIDPGQLLANIFMDTTTHSTIDEWRDRSGSLADKPLARRLELWHRIFIGGSISFDPEVVSLVRSVQHQATAYAAESNVTPSAAERYILRTQKERNQSRRYKLWAAFNRVENPTIPEYQTLVKAYNRKARSYGFPNYYSLMLYLQGIDERWLTQTMHSLETLSRHEYERIIISTKKKFHIKFFAPWDLPLITVEPTPPPDKYFPSDSMLPFIHRFENEIGFEIDSLPISTRTLKDTNGSQIYACSIPNDVRIIFDSETGATHYYSGLYCWGEALHTVSTNVEYPILKGYGLVNGSQNPAYYQGIACFHGSFVSDSAWIINTLHPKDTRFIFTKKISAPIVALRQALATFSIEYELYKNPDQDLDSLEGAIMKNILLIDTSVHPKESFKLHSQYFAVPCNSHTGLLAEMIAAQLHEARISKFGNEKTPSPKIASWLIDFLYRSGETLEWLERIRNATGKSVEPGAYLRKLGIEQMNLLLKDSKE